MPPLTMAAKPLKRFSDGRYRGGSAAGPRQCSYEQGRGIGYWKRVIARAQAGSPARWSRLTTVVKSDQQAAVPTSEEGVPIESAVRLEGFGWVGFMPHECR